MWITRRVALLGAAALGFPRVLRAAGVDPALQALIDGPQRSEKNRARDPFRHPAEVLTFFGVRPDSVVVEILPGAGGYWTEILAPYLKDTRPLHRGQCRGGHDLGGSSKRERRLQGQDRRQSRTLRQGGDHRILRRSIHEIAAPASADFVLSFRNLHNWMARGEAEASFRAFFAALKRGGALGIEDHRGAPDHSAGPARQIRLRAAGLRGRSWRKRRVQVRRRPRRSAPIRRTPRTIPSASGRCRRPIA